MKNKNHMITSIDAKKKRIWQNSTSLSDKNPQQSGYGGNVPQHNKGHIWQAHS